MKIPPNMTEEQVITEITNVVNKMSHRYTFYGYEVDDIKQEAFIMCMDAMDRYDAARPLENFLSVHLSNRLKNFVRDNHFTKNEDEKKKVMMPGQLANEQYLLDGKSSGGKQDEQDPLDYQHLSYILDLKLPSEYRSDYLKIVNDVYVPKKRKEEVLSVIEDIMGEHGHA